MGEVNFRLPPLSAGSSGHCGHFPRSGGRLAPATSARYQAAMLSTDTRSVYDEDLSVFRDQVRKFFDKALTPNLDRWEDEGIVDRGFWLACGEAGLLCP